MYLEEVEYPTKLKLVFDTVPIKCSELADETTQNTKPLKHLRGFVFWLRGVVANVLIH